jgi:hypothetical protein
MAPSGLKRATGLVSTAGRVVAESEESSSLQAGPRSQPKRLRPEHCAALQVSLRSPFASNHTGAILAQPWSSLGYPRVPCIFSAAPP